MTDGEKRYQILRGRLYERLPVLALALGLLDWREAEKPERTDSFSTHRYPFWQKRKQTAKRRRGRFFTACCMQCWGTSGSAGTGREGKWSIACDMAAEFLASRMLGLTLQDDAAKAFYALEPERLSRLLPSTRS